jgi:hypothetical protein
MQTVAALSAVNTNVNPVRRPGISNGLTPPDGTLVPVEAALTPEAAKRDPIALPGLSIGLVRPVVYERKWKIDPASKEAANFAITADYYCAICCEIVWEPVVCGSCGKLSCGECIGRWKTASGNPYRCPTCRATSLATSITASCNVAIKNLLGKLRVKCPGYAHAEAGCQWTGDYFDAAQHVELRCQFATLSCPHCGLSMCRRDHSQHVLSCPKKPILCPDCALGPFSPAPGGNLETHRLKDCPKTPCSCEHCGIWKGCRESLATHVSACPDLKTACEIPGCKTVIRRREMAAHLSADAVRHVQVLICENTRLKSTIDALSTKISSLTKTNHVASDATLTGVAVHAGIKRRHEAGWDSDDDDAEDKDTTKAPRRPPGWLACTTKPACPFNGFYNPNNPFGRRCVECNTTRRRAKVECDSQTSPDCWRTVYPHPQFGSTCKPCRDSEQYSSHSSP